jgi:short-subunit dehydrogenase
MEARDVARAGFEGMLRGSGVVVPGWLNKFIALSTELLPSAITLEINRFLLHERS